MTGMDSKEISTTGNKIRATCTACRNVTNHVVTRSVDLSGSDEEAGVSYETSYQIIECQGCNGVSYRTVSWDSESMDYDPDQPVTREQQFPDPKIGRAPVWGNFVIPLQLERVYVETVKALNEGQLVLCGMGVRAVVESIVKDQKASGKLLSDQIDSLAKQGMLTTSGAAILHQVRALGNEAAHEVVAHGKDELSLALDVIDNLLQAVYILPTQASSTFEKFAPKKTSGVAG